MEGPVALMAPHWHGSYLIQQNTLELPSSPIGDDVLRTYLSSLPSSRIPHHRVASLTLYADVLWRRRVGELPQLLDAPHPQGASWTCLKTTPDAHVGPAHASAKWPNLGHYLRSYGSLLVTVCKALDPA